MKWFLILFLSIGHGDFPVDDYQLASIQKVPYDTWEECNAEAVRLSTSDEPFVTRGTLVMAHLCFETPLKETSE